MTRTPLRRILALAATTGFAIALAGCGPDDGQQSRAAAPLLSQAGIQPGWSMADLAGVDPAFLEADAAPLPQALPMRASYDGDYAYAPAYDYGPEPYDDVYYTEPDTNDYQWLALAAALGGMLGNAPPDYAFGYGGVQPWAWETGDRYLRYAEPVYGGYRYYYYEPDSYTPFLVSDPYYSYGYRDDRLVVIYDRSGRLIDARRAERQRRAAHDYFERARQMYRAAHRERHAGVSASLWQRHRDEVARERHRWDKARSEREAWQQWDARNARKLHRDWAGEALVRREAERSFAGWQKAAFKTPAPRFYTARRRQAQLHQVAAIRRQQRAVKQRAQRDAQRHEAAAGHQAQRQHADLQQQLAFERDRHARQVAAVRTREQPHARTIQRNEQRQAQAQRAKARQQARAQQAAQHRQAEARRAKSRQREQVQAQKAAHERQARAERAKAQRQARAHRAQAQQQARRASEQRRQSARRQQAAREHRLVAQRAAQQRQARQAQQARAAQAKQAHAREAAQRQARRRHQAQARQSAQGKAQQQRSSRQAHQRGNANAGHPGGHGHKRG